MAWLGDCDLAEPPSTDRPMLRSFYSAGTGAAVSANIPRLERQPVSEAAARQADDRRAGASRHAARKGDQGLLAVPAAPVAGGGTEAGLGLAD